MRSRYTAYATGAVDYLLRTHEPPPARASVEKFAAQATFTKLQILATQALGEDEGEVEFKASYTEAGIPNELHERSRFMRIGGEWRYVGSVPIPKVGRNDPCPCGSGKKYKKCCA